MKNEEFLDFLSLRYLGLQIAWLAPLPAFLGRTSLGMTRRALSKSKELTDNPTRN